MDTSLDALYAAQALSAQATSTTGAQQQAGTGTEFAEMLEALSGTSSDANQMQQYLFSGLADGSINVTDSGKLVSALLSTLDGGSSLEGLMDYDALSSGAAGGLSSDTIKSLLDLNQNAESDWLEKILQAFSVKDEDAETEKSDDSLQNYYQALAALAQVQKDLMPEE